tara:strand:+ start:22 stop:546 length:525 start_codon:yes stop_codon:yes gene_type:complete
MKKKVANKGYTLEIQSVEGRKENKTKQQYTVQTEKEALLLKKLSLELFSNSFDNEYGIGNILEHECDIAESRIVKYLVNNPEILELNKISFLPEDLENQVKIFFIEQDINENWIDYIEEYLDLEDNIDLIQDWITLIMDLNIKLLGEAKDYFSKITQNCDIFYSEKDLFVSYIN